MIDIDEIEETIQELEGGELTLSSCADLAHLYIIRDHIDALPQSDINENMQDLQDMIIEYMINRDIVQLNILLTKLSQIISELYHTAESDDERVEFRDFIYNISQIN